MKLTENSWAAERFEELGEKLEPEELPVTRMTKELLNTPTEAVTKLAEEILSLNIMEVQQLLKAVQRRLGMPEEWVHAGICGNGGGGPAAAGAAQEVEVEVVKEKEAFDLKLLEYDAKVKIKIIKEVRAITGLGLKEAKEMVENAPIVVKQGLKKEEAEKLMQVLADAGAKAELI